MRIYFKSHAHIPRIQLIVHTTSKTLYTYTTYICAIFPISTTIARVKHEDMYLIH